VNKADYEGADRLAQTVTAMLALQTFAPDAWRPPILKTEATSGAGIQELLDAIKRFRVHSAPERTARQRSRHEFRLRDLVTQRVLRLVDETLGPRELQRVIDTLVSREVDPYSAASDIMRRVAVHMAAPAAGDVRRS
jgi:LAO/AO transport system kinase